MALDPSIPLSVKPVQINTPFESLGQLMQLKNEQQRGQLQGLQIQGAQSDLAAKQRAQQDAAAYAQIIRSNMGEDAVLKAVAEQAPALFQQTQEHYAKLKKEAADLARTEGATEKDRTEVQVKRQEFVDKILGTLKDTYESDGAAPAALAWRSYVPMLKSMFGKDTSIDALDQQFQQGADSMRAVFNAHVPAKPVTNETDLAYRAAKGDQNAIDALALKNPPKPTERQPGSFAEYTDPNTTPERRAAILKARGEYGTADNGVSVNVNGGGGYGMSTDAVDASRPSKADPSSNRPDPKIGYLTPNALYQNALSFALTGTMPVDGRASTGPAAVKKNMIQNKASALAAQAGVDLPQLRAEYKANAATLAKLMPNFTATSNAAHIAEDNLDLAQQSAAQVARSGSKLVNRYAQWLQGNLTPAAGLTRLETNIYTAAREYAKVTSGGAASAAGLTDSAQKEADKLINATQSPEAFDAAVNAMKADMGNVTKNNAKTLAGISSTIGRFFAASNGIDLEESAAPQAPSAATPQSSGKIGRFTVEVTP